MYRLTDEYSLFYLQFIEKNPVPPDVPTEAPDPEKLKHNCLSPIYEDFLRLGWPRERLVEEYFNGCSNPDLGEQIAETFRKHYQKMRDNNWTQDAIFTELYSSAGGLHFLSPMKRILWI